MAITDEEFLTLQEAVNDLIDVVNAALVTKLQWQQVNSIFEAELNSIKERLDKIESDIKILQSFHN